jgi:FlaA1/EpsC-like NDP-sugar epimerase
MGASKRIAEQIVLSHAPYGASYCTVRFGNVLGSRGSVIPTFARQIATGGPVTVTDDRMTRFFMSVEEAVQLVLESSVLSDGGGEVFMLEMGEPVRILDLAERMIRLSGYQVGTDIPIEIVGVRPGEKLDEELRTPEEAILTTYHPYINQLIPITAPEEQFAEGIEQLREATARRDADEVKALLFSVGALRHTVVGGTTPAAATTPDVTVPAVPVPAVTVPADVVEPANTTGTERNGHVAVGDRHHPAGRPNGKQEPTTTHQIPA